MNQKPGQSIRVMVVDDEELARIYLRPLIQAHPEMSIVAECKNGFEAVKAAVELSPDLMFLDVQMPKLDGFEVCQLIDQNICVIFVTAYDQYALRAFEVYAVDYLLKPFSPARFEEALARARRRLGQPQPAIQPDVETQTAKPLGRLVVRDGTLVVFIPVQQLDYAQAQADYLALHTQGKSYLKNQTIAELEASLDPNQFVRIHRSFIVNLERIARIEPYSKDDKLAILKDKTQLPISRSGYKKLKQLLDGKR